MSKGSVLDLPMILVVIFISAIGIIVAGKIWNSFDAAFDPEYATATEIVNSATVAVKNFNTGFLILTVGLAIAAVIGAFLIPSHPIFFFISLIILGLMMFVAPQFSNAWNMFIHDTSVSDIGNDYPIMVNVMENLPKIIFGIGGLILVAMYSKSRRGTY